MKREMIAWLVIGLVTFGCVLASNAAIILGDVTDNGGGSYTISSGPGSVPDASLESWIGLPLGTLDAMAVTASPYLVTEGSAIQQTAMMAAGDVLSFDWVWTSDENTFSQPDEFNDFSFYSLTFVGASTIVDRFAPNGTSGTITWTAPTAGAMTLAVGVVDVGDTDYDSWLNVSNVVIPEPSSMAMIGLVAGCGLFIRRRFIL